jgi:hypothetical protein
MAYHFITWLLGLLGRKKDKEKRFYGIVYDSITKEPVSLAIVRVYKLEDVNPESDKQESRKLVGTQVTDKEGRYQLLLKPGRYQLEIKKPEYVFPSTIVKSGPDGEYQTVYSGELILEGEEFIQVPDIPIDPENTQRKWQVSGVFKKLWLSLQKVGHYLAVPVLVLGAVASVLTVSAVPHNPINWILAAFYVLMLILQLTFRKHPEKAWGMVYDLATNAPVPLTTLQLIDPEFGKVVKSRLSDYQGRFSFLPEPGKYIIKANKEGYEQTEVIESPREDREPITGEVEIEKKDQRISGDVPMRQV